jgi:hypothetical protein
VVMVRSRIIQCRHSNGNTVATWSTTNAARK